MQIYTVSFFGHRHINEPFRIMRELEECVRELLKEKEYVEFLVGRNGEFDQLATSAVHHMKKKYRNDNSELTLVLPYLTAEYWNNKDSFEAYYNRIEVYGEASNIHPKAVIQKRNRAMVDRADLIVCCIDTNSGGAYETVQYAIRKGKKVVNIEKKKAQE